MNKTTIIILIFLAFNMSEIFSQELIDHYVGRYSCSVSNCSINQFGQYECNNSSNSTLNFEKTFDQSQIEVFFADNNHFILSRENDSIFSHAAFPYISALFYPDDSVKLSRVHSSVGYSIYKGKKNPTAIDKKPHVLKIKVTPNPFDNQILIENIDIKNPIIQLLDTNGKSLNIQIINNKNHVFIKTDDINQGIYILKIINSYSTFSYKMLKL